MAKRAPRLQFTEEERASPELAPAIQKADKKIKKLEKAEAKIPKKEVKQRVVDSDGKITTRLSFEEKKPPSKLSHAAKVSGDAVLHGVHREVRQSNDGDNAGVDAANTLTEDAESAYQVGRNIHRAHELKPYRKAHRAEKKADKANVKALNQEFAQQNEGFSSNPYSRWQQKRAIKREYAAAKYGRGTVNTVKASEVTKKAAEKSAEAGKKVGEFVAKHKKGFLIVGLIAAVFLLFTNLFSSCSLMFQGASSSIAASTYPSLDEDMLAAEAQYCAMEAELQARLDNYEAEHDYDEYHYELDDIEHDPYVLISAITALMGREWTISEVGGILDMLFEKQYILTETVETETRYRTETRTGSYTYYDYELENTLWRCRTPITSVPSNWKTLTSVMFRSTSCRRSSFPSMPCTWALWATGLTCSAALPMSAGIMEVSIQSMRFHRKHWRTNSSRHHQGSGKVSWVPLRLGRQLTVYIL